MDNINFCARYDLSDKANVFSRKNRRAIKKIVEKMDADDVICIGSRKYDPQDFINDKPNFRKEIRFDYIVDGKGSSIRYDDRIEGYSQQHNSKISARKQNRLFGDFVCKDIIETLNELAAIPRKPITEKTFTERHKIFNDMHNTKLNVRQWSRLKKAYDNNSLYERFRTELYKIKDSFTDEFEEIFKFIR